jgi:hypothetical protein
LIVDLEAAHGAAAWEPLADQPMLCVARPVHAPLEQTPDGFFRATVCCVQHLYVNSISRVL